MGEGEKLERRGKSWQQGRPFAAASQSRRQCGGQRRCAEPADGLWGLFILSFPFPEHPSAAAQRDNLQRPAVEGPGNSSGSEERPRGSDRNGFSTGTLSQNGYGAPTFCEPYTRGPRAPASYGCVGPPGEAARSRSVEAPCVLQDFMPSRLAGSGSNCLEGGAGTGSWQGRAPLQRRWCRLHAEPSGRQRARSRRVLVRQGCGFRAQRPPVSTAKTTR